MYHRAMAPQSQQQQQQQLGDASKKVKLLCSYGGRFHPRPNDAALRYAGGHTRIVSVPRDVAFQDFMRKMADAHGGAPAVVKYQLPGHDLDSLITVLCPDDLLNMMEEHDKLAAASASSAHDPKLRLFLFPSSDRGPEGDAAIGDSSAPATPEAPEIAAKPLAVVPAGMLVAPPSHTYAAEATKEMIPVPQVQYVTPQPPIVGAPVGLVAVAPPQAQYVPVVPLTTAPATPVPQETQYVPLATAAPATQQPLIASQPPPEASTYVERRLVHFPSDPSYAAARVGVGLPPAPPPAQAMLLDECAMCKRRLPHAHSEAVLRQEHGLGPTDEKMGLLSLQPETTMWSQVSPGTTPATCAADAGRYAQLAMPTAGYGFMEQATPPDAGGYAQFVTVQNVPAIDASGYTQMANVETAQRGLVIPGVGASSGEERLYPSGFTASPVLSEVPFSYFTQAAATGDALQQQGARQLPTHQYPIPQQFAASKQENGNSPFSSAGEAHPQGSGSTPESTYNANLPVKGVVEIYATPPDVSHAVEQWKEDAELSDKTIPDKFCSNDLAGEEEIFLGRNFGARGMLPEGRYMKKAWEPSRLEDDLLCDVPPQESRQLRSLLGDAGVCPPADVVAQSPSRYQLAQPQTNRDAGKVPVVRVNESDTDFQSAAVLGLSGTQKLEEIKDSSLVCSNPDPWKIMQDSNKLPPMPMKVAGQSLIPKHLLTENEKKDGGNTLPTFSSEEEDHRQLPGFLNKDSDSDMIQFMTGEKFKQDLQPVEKEVTSTHQVHENSTMVNKLQLEAQLTEGFGKLQIIRNQDLEELSELGSGTFGTVYHGKWRGSDVAIKRINDRCFIGKPSEQERQRSDFWNEACKLAELHHPNVVSFYGVVLDGPGGSVATVTEYMANGSLHGALQQKDKRVLDRRKRLLIAMDAAFGMEYLHKKNIVHFDLKSDNLLVNLKDPQRPICKVGDLGLSKVKCKTLISGGVRGTLPWMAPELLNGRSSLVSEKVDIYSFGIVMWELLTGEEPYEDMHYGAIIGGIINNTLRPPVPESCDPEWKCLMESCWASEPSQRPTFTEIVAKLRSMATFSPPKFKPQVECTSPTFSR